MKLLFLWVQELTEGNFMWGNVLNAKKRPGRRLCKGCMGPSISGPRQVDSQALRGIRSTTRDSQKGKASVHPPMNGFPDCSVSTPRSVIPPEKRMTR